MKEMRLVEKKVLDVLRKNNLDLMDKLEKTKEALQFYGEKREYQTWIGVGRNKERRGRIWKDNGKIARKALKEIEK